MTKRQLSTSGALSEYAIQAVLDSVGSLHTRRAYDRHLREFSTWHRKTGAREITKELVTKYAAQLQRRKLSPATVNQKLSAIRTLALHAASAGTLDSQIADGIKAVHGLKHQSATSGHALTKQAAQRLLNTPDTKSLKGMRDRAILALLIGCGLRRSEIVALTYDKIQRRSGRAVLVDLAGERSVPVPKWTREALSAYTRGAGLTSGVVFRRITGGKVASGKMTEQAIYNLVVEIGNACGLGNVSPNDLRLTFATLAYEGGSTLDQIQLALGHGSIRITQRYLGIKQDLKNAPGDHLGLSLGD